MKSVILNALMGWPAFFLALTGGYGCNPTEGLPACSDVDSPGIIPNHARLTGAPTFSSLEIASGDPLRIAVPVDVNTRVVSVRILSTNRPGVGAGGEAETNGGETVDVMVRDTDLPAGVYFANSIVLEGERSEQRAAYFAKNAESQYTQSTNIVGESGFFCLTDFAAAQFRVTGNALEQP